MSETYTERRSNWREFTPCADFTDVVRRVSDRVVVIDPDFPPTGFCDRTTAELRQGLIGPAHARVPEGGDRRQVELLFDSHDPTAYGLEPWQGSTAARSLTVPVDSLLKAEIVSASTLPEDEIVTSGSDHHGFPGKFDLMVTFAANAALYRLLPERYIEIYDPRHAEPFFTFKAAALPAGPNSYELWLLMGGRGGSAPMDLPEQYLLGRGGDGPAYAWPVYATYGGPAPTPDELTGGPIELGKIYVYGAGRPCVPVSEEGDGRHTVLLLDDSDGVPEYREAQRTDLAAITEAQRESFSRDYAGTLISALIQTSRERRSYAERADSLREQRDQARRNHENDIEVISSRLIEEAESRSWCSEYDHVIDSLNESLHVQMRERQHEFEVTARVTYYVTVTVSARDRDSAEEMIDNDKSLVLDELNDSDYDNVTVIEVSRA